MSYANAEKLLRLCLRLASSRGGMSIDDIAEEFETTRRSAERMRDAVQNLFPSLFFVRDDDNLKRWRLPKGIVNSLIGLEAEDLAVLGAARELLTNANRQTDADRLSSLETRIRALLSSSSERRIEPDLDLLMYSEGLSFRPGPRIRIDPGNLKLMREAILSSRRVKFRMDLRAGGVIEEAIVEPYGVLYGSRPFLLAKRPGGSGVKQYRLQSISQLTLTDEAFVADPDFDIRTYARDSFGAFREPPFDVEWRFHPSVASDAAEYLFHPDQETEPCADGSLIVRFRAGGALEMAWHLNTWGVSVEVIKPTDFRDRVKQSLERLAGRSAHQGAQTRGNMTTGESGARRDGSDEE